MILWSSEAEARGRELNEGGQNMHISGYKRSTKDIMYNKGTVINSAVQSM